MNVHLTAQRFASLIVMLVFVVSTPRAQAEEKVVLGVDPELGTLVTTEWLAAHHNDPDLVILDCTVLVTPSDDGSMTSSSGRESYTQGHIPNAGFADLVNDLSDKESPLEFTMPSIEQFTRTMGLLGVGDNSRVVLYDAYGSVWAARVWWMLKWAGFDRAAILDGGLSAWKAEGRPLSTEPAVQTEKLLTANVRPELIADRDEVFASIDDDDVMLIDALPESHYRGEMVMYEWPGHIPGATNIPSFSLLDETGHYLPKSELGLLLTGDRDARTITYCGGGIAASSNAFILTRLGFTNVALYDGSLDEWTADPENPMVVDTP